jgi:3-hydroxyacyl-CoA dehydrogenase
MNRSIRKVAVLGSGVMGSAIACHFANIGCRVLLLDMVPRELNDEERAKGLTLESKQVRNRIVNQSLERAIRSNPAPLYDKSFASRIITGNFEDDMHIISKCDWVLEAVVENLEIKKKIFAQVEQHRKPGTIVSSNTSGIPISSMLDGRSEDFRKHFCGTHFFNPPRYLKLLEIIPTPHTDPEVVKFLMRYGDLYLGKTTVLCKDTPAFIANRIGVFGIMKVIRTMEKLGLTIDDIDKLTGPVIGRPKSATFRTSDIVGLDTMIKVANNLYAGLPNDEARDVFKPTDAILKMESNQWLGDKTGQGFYKKTKNAKGQTEILTLDLSSFEYKPKAKSSFATLESTKPIVEVRKRFKVLLAGKDKAGEFYRETFYALFSYVSHRIPEIADELYKIDDAMRAGFGWEVGPFETWDAIGLRESLAEMKDFPVAPWVYEMIEAGHASFYRIEDGRRQYYDIATRSYKDVPGREAFIILEDLKNRVVWRNSESAIIHLGDGVLNFSWSSKGSTLTSPVIEGMNRAIDLAERQYEGLVVGHQQADYDELDFMVRQFQRTVMRIRYSSVPVVVCPKGRTLGGGCEITLHADRVQAAAESYIGLVEIGVGLIPAGGGTKEMTKRVSDAFEEGDIELNTLQNAFMTIATAKVSLSAEEARGMKILRANDRISVNVDRQLADAKAAVLDMAASGYTMPIQSNNIKVQGRTGLALFLAGIHGMREGNYITEHDAKIASKIAYVMCGGDLTSPQQVSEQYLLDLEREAFVSLCGERKTLERIQAVVTGGKPIRN